MPIDIEKVVQLSVLTYILSVTCKTKAQRKAALKLLLKEWRKLVEP